ncbi:interleukin-15 receptor subunit alpha-like isoform X3 [Acipenser oxyrinchus oxyrinchus]|uniref:Interleukin-15 receptor subunit alpha-like isoform X3 n=1 Tax=Acipenser oxyrinchus oxyrinchus TaxID=40147 RepID=A0AAD8DHG2_ACIOX|nr:interleukin-15 receptor subunit alpha-like isoform X3 [Acipenser oxyrinchus oxyrinchus]
MNYRPVAFLLLFSFPCYTEHDTVWAADKYSTDKCKHPVQVEFTDEFEEHSFLVGQSYRYNCKRGYKRKAGTSSLIHCMNESGTVQWSLPNLKCIRDPKLKGATDPPQINKGSTAAPAQPKTKATTTRTTTVEGKKIALPETPPPSVPTTENRMSSQPVITGQVLEYRTATKAPETATSTELSTITVPYVSTAEASSSSASPPALTTQMPVPSTARPSQHTTADITAGIVETTDRERASASPSPTSPTTQYRVSSTEPIVTYNIPDITEQSSDISVGAKAGGSIAAVLLFIIIITAIVICIYKIKWGRNIIVTPASELQPMTNPEQPPPDVVLISNVPVTQNGDTD